MILIIVQSTIFIKDDDPEWLPDSDDEDVLAETYAENRDIYGSRYKNKAKNYIDCFDTFSYMIVYLWRLKQFKIITNFEDITFQSQDLNLL